MEQSPTRTVTHLLQQRREGMPLVYEKLRRIAAGYLRRERQDLTFQATAVVHEAYLRLSRSKQGSGNALLLFFNPAFNRTRAGTVPTCRRRRFHRRRTAWTRRPMQ